MPRLRDTIDFYLFDWLAVESLTSISRFSEHDASTFAQVLDLSERMADELFAPANRIADAQEPAFDGQRVLLPEASHTAVTGYLESGLVGATQDHAHGGMQLPVLVSMAAGTFFGKASFALAGYGMLTAANASLILAHGSERQKGIFGAAELAGRWAGTMCLSEPQAGSSLSDVATRAVPDGEAHEDDPLGPRYRLFGNKMWISGGDHEITDNILHLVLAKIPDVDGSLPVGVKGLSLFVVPKRMVDQDGQLTGERNDVVLAGLNHKLGCRGTTNALLNFGEGAHPVGGQPGAIGYRIGAAGEGLACMFHMMNEARIGVGLGAVALGLASHEASVGYARERLQGRPVGNLGKDTAASQVAIIEHVDVRRMLLAQKAYAEGGLALTYYCARLADYAHHPNKQEADSASLLLELLLPVVKSWPSEWCLEANSLGIQIHGGYGYTRDFPVEQHWRDNRLNMIHEGTHGIQALDLLGRKVTMKGGAALRELLNRVVPTLLRAQNSIRLQPLGKALNAELDALMRATRATWATFEPERALANATDYLRAFGHVSIAWMWLEVSLAAEKRLARIPDDTLALGKLMAAEYFFHHELPKVDHWLTLVSAGESTCVNTRPDWF